MNSLRDRIRTVVGAAAERVAHPTGSTCRLTDFAVFLDAEVVAPPR